MSDDERQREYEREHGEALVRLLEAVAAVAGGAPSVDALYELDHLFEYQDLVHEARDSLLAAIQRSGTAEAWSATLRQLPSQRALWARSFDRRGFADENLAELSAEWATAGPERMFRPHHHVSSAVSEVAQLHLWTLAALDARGAVEWVASLPDQHFVWSGFSQLALGHRPDLVDEVVGSSRSVDAVMLVLASGFARHEQRVSARLNDRRWRWGASRPHDDEDVALIRQRYRAISEMLVERADAGAVVGPWLRFLVKQVDAASGDRSRLVEGRVAQIAVHELERVLGRVAPISLVPAPGGDTSCVSARVVADRSGAMAAKHWRAWVSLVVAEHKSLRFTCGTRWSLAATALAGVDDPHAAWLEAARELEPVLRHRARRASSNPHPIAHLVMPGMFAAMALGPAGESLWRAVYELARRQFLVERTSRLDGVERHLAAHMFVAFQRVFGDNGPLLDAYLAQLPTDELIAEARRHIAAAAGAEEAQENLMVRRQLVADIDDVVDAIWFGSGRADLIVCLDTSKGTLVDVPVDELATQHAPVPRAAPDEMWRVRRFVSLYVDSDPALAGVEVSKGAAIQQLEDLVAVDANREQRWAEFNRNADRRFAIDWIATLGWQHG